jgi:4'-phosphopantetheinyl transferase
MTTAPSCPDRGDVRVWHARPGDVWSAPGALSRALRWLTPPERARHDRYRHDSDRQMFLLGRAMARVLVGQALGVAPTAWRWRDAERGRPEIDSPSCPISFNLAHSGDLVVCAITRDAVVGVDVEDRARAVLDRRIVARYCAPAERVAIDALGDHDWQDRFLQYWTLKEAYLKARGLGIAVPLADLSFALAGPDGITLSSARTPDVPDATWAFSLSTLGDRHYVAAAVSTGHDRAAPRFSFHPMPFEVLA